MMTWLRGVVATKMTSKTNRPKRQTAADYDVAVVAKRFLLRRRRLRETSLKKSSAFDPSTDPN